MNRLSQLYYYNTNEKLNDFLHLLNCREQILFFELQPYNIDYNTFFCDDINLTFSNTKNIKLNVNKLHMEDEIFIWNRLNSKKDNILNEIKDNLSNNKLVVVRTMIDMLQQYDVYTPNKIGNRDGHLFSLIGFENKKFFYVDSPFMLNNS